VSLINLLFFRNNFPLTPLIFLFGSKLLADCLLTFPKWPTVIVGSGIANAILNPSILSRISSSLTVVMSTNTGYQKTKYSEAGTLRKHHKSLRGKVNELVRENHKLKSNILRLEASVTEVENVGNDLSRLADTSKVDRFVEVVKEFKRINAKIKVCHLVF